MLVTVLGVRADPDAVTVECATPAGPLTARWSSPRIPRTGDVDVEIDVPARLAWGEDLRLVGGPARSCRGQVVVGRVEDVENDFVVLRIAGGVLALETIGCPPLGVLGELVAVTTETWEMWPTGT